MSLPTSVFNETSPAPVSTVTAVTNNIVIADGQTQFVHEVVQIGIFNQPEELTYIPVAGTFSLYKNGQLLTETTDYALTSNQIVLVTAPIVTDVFVVDYLAQP